MERLLLAVPAAVAMAPERQTVSMVQPILVAVAAAALTLSMEGTVVRVL
jgi:hypothetical protein